MLEEERAYFHTRDHDGDGSLNRDEFLRQVGRVPISDVRAGPSLTLLLEMQLNEEIAHIWEDEAKRGRGHKIEKIPLPEDLDDLQDRELPADTETRRSLRSDSSAVLPLRLESGGALTSSVHMCS